ncbi:hypothetical protein EJC49_22810 [Aquibium carbonis]|uniref:Uncharacterized protein n=1 Tax=Aquibium carbonis TaxID=2495581 RepID=A0A3S0A3G7_9HYPH|nr:hypothetical protein [Aquibium carbonis]RST83118.1 hypothetical protein EJC49_22810 [Aquibium carbonis]
MSAIVTSRAGPARLDLMAELHRREPRFAAMGLIMLMLMLPTAFAALVDLRAVSGVNVWIKPLKFQASLAAYLLTLAWFAAFLPAGVTDARWYRRYSALVVGMVGIEMLWLMGASFYGVPSHFNRDGGFLEIVYPVMGLFAIGLTTATLVYGVLIGRDPRSTLAPAMRASLSLGLVLTFVLTVLAAGFLAGGQGHFVGEATTASALPVLGWARDGGDLRVAHFFATHAMQIIPAFGLMASALPARQGVIVVQVFAAGFVVFTGLVLFQAMRGLPFPG